MVLTDRFLQDEVCVLLELVLDAVEVLLGQQARVLVRQAFAFRKRYAWNEEVVVRYRSLWSHGLCCLLKKTFR